MQKSNQDFIQLSGEIFERVQNEKLFNDEKVFVDSYPAIHPDEIRKNYYAQKTNKEFDFKNFILTHFSLPTINEIAKTEEPSTEKYIKNTWDILKRHIPKEPDHSTLISLPNSYIVSDERFNETYYWGTYFSLLGLKHEKNYDLMIDICKNFCHLIEKYELIPAGNRVYYESRSQPPFFSLMVNLIEDHISSDLLRYFVDCIEKEYNFWMLGSEDLSVENRVTRRVYFDEEGFLNRYYDDGNGPRVEAYTKDLVLASGFSTNEERELLYKNIKAATESGWEFSSRWLKDIYDFSTIQTTNILPVDLNCLLFNIEKSLFEWFEKFNDNEKSLTYFNKAEKRRKLIQKYFWNDEKGFYFDYNISEQKQTDCYSLAGAYPLFFEIPNEEEADKVAQHIEREFLHEGGLITTINKSGEEWDSPNGWAPLQWIVYKGLNNYGYKDLAGKVRKKWIDTCDIKYVECRKFFEKYNVKDIEVLDKNSYQNGFGWTNGVYMYFLYSR